MLYREIPLSFESSGREIFGFLQLPSRSRRKSRCVVFAHGFTGEKIEHHRIFVLCAGKLAHAGIASLRFDFGFSGDNEVDFKNTAISSRVNDFRQAVDFISRFDQKLLDSQHLGALGFTPLSEIGKLKPVLLVHGMTDENFPFENSRELYKVAKDPRKFVVVENSSHVFFGLTDRDGNPRKQ